MFKSIISLAVLGTLVTPAVYAAEAAKTETKEESNWSLTTNMGYVSDYRARGVSQTWRKEAIQGGFDLTHSSGFYLGAFGSNVSPNTYPKANVELDLYAGYNGTVAAVEGLGYTAGVIGYFYPNGSWKKYTLSNAEPGIPQTPQGGRWDTYEANAGISYKWLSAKGIRWPDFNRPRRPLRCKRRIRSRGKFCWWRLRSKHFFNKCHQTRLHRL